MIKCIRIAILTLFAFLLISTTPLTAFAETQRSDYVVNGTVEERGLSASQCPDLGSASVILKDSSGKLYYSRNSEEKVKIASLTKLATAYIALKNSSLDTEISVSSNAVAVGGSSAGFRAGDTMKLIDAMKGLMIPSGNDAAVAIAESIGKSIANTTDATSANSAFVQKMNDAAASIGCTNTLFTNAHGLDADEFASDAHSTASDVMKMVEECMKIDTFKEIVKQDSATITVTNNGTSRELELETTDPLLGQFDGACGVKTGTTDAAGYCFAGACERNGEMVFSVVLGATTDSGRFSDTQNLFNWVFDNMVDYKLCNADGNTMAYAVQSDWLDKTIPATISNVDETIRVFKYDGNISQSVELNSVSRDVKSGDKVGSITFWQNNKAIKTLDLVSQADVSRPNILETVQIALTRFWHIFTGEKNEASSSVINDTPVLIEYK